MIMYSSGLSASATRHDEPGRGFRVGGLGFKALGFRTGVIYTIPPWREAGLTFLLHPPRLKNTRLKPCIVDCQEELSTVSTLT